VAAIKALAGVIAACCAAPKKHAIPMLLQVS
jgi:hypothetical protein